MKSNNDSNDFIKITFSQLIENINQFRNRNKGAQADVKRMRKHLDELLALLLDD